MTETATTNELVLPSSLLTLTPAECYELEDAEVDRLIELTCAMNGIPLPSEISEEEGIIYREASYKRPEKDVVVYKVGGFELLDQSEAEQLAALVRGFYSHAKTRYIGYRGGDENFGSVVEGTEAPGSITVAQEAHYSDEVWSLHGSSIIEHAKLEKERKQNREDRESQVEEVQRVRSAVHRYLDQQYGAHRQREHTQRMWKRMLDLADWDHKVALRFLLDRRSWADVIDGLEIPQEVVELAEAEGRPPEETRAVTWLRSTYKRPPATTTDPGEGLDQGDL